MTSPSRVLAILGLFDETRPVWHTDEINAALAYTRATGYRYVKDLVEAGFLQKVSAGHYALGARIIELDYQLRRSDPVLLAAVPVMERLVARSRLDSVLSAMFGLHVVDTYRASGDADLKLGYGRGRPRPLFLGAAPKVLLAHRSRAQLARLFESHGAEAAAAGLGASWDAFRTFLAQVRADGFYLSKGELERTVGAAAIPLLDDDGDALAALSLVGTPRALADVGPERLKRLLDRAAEEIRDGLAAEAKRRPATGRRGR